MLASMKRGAFQKRATGVHVPARPRRNNRSSILAYRVLVDELDLGIAGALRAPQFVGHSGLEWLLLDGTIGPENCPYLRREIEDNRLDLRAGRGLEEFRLWAGWPD